MLPLASPRPVAAPAANPVAAPPQPQVLPAEQPAMAPDASVPPMPFPGPYAFDPAPHGASEAAAPASRAQGLARPLADCFRDAVRTGDLDKVHELIRKGCGINGEVPEPGRHPRPLAEAARRGHAGVVEALLQAGADPDLQDKDGLTALMNAVRNEKTAVVEALLRHPGINLECASPSGSTALDFATHGEPEITALLLKAGAKFELDAYAASSLMRRAIRYEHGGLAKLILSRFHAHPERLAFLWGDASAHAFDGKCMVVAEAILDACGKLRVDTGSCIHSLGRMRSIHAENVSTVTTAVAAYEGALLTEGLAPRVWELKEDARVLLGYYFFPIAIADLANGAGRQHEDSSSASVAATPDGRIDRRPMIDLLPAAVRDRQEFMDWLHCQDIPLAIASALADFVAGRMSELMLLANPGCDVNAHQEKQYYACALSRVQTMTMDGEPALIYRLAGISPAGVARTVAAGRAPLERFKSLAEDFLRRQGEALLERLVPACRSQTRNDYRIDTDALGASLVEAGLIAPLAQAVAASWRQAVDDLFETPLAMPPGATFGQLAQAMNDAFDGLDRSHFGARLQAKLKTHELLPGLRRMTEKADTRGNLDLVFQVQVDLLQQYCAHLQQS